MIQAPPYSRHTKQQWRRLRQRVAGQLIAPLDDAFHGLIATADICGCQCRDCLQAHEDGVDLKPLPPSLVNTPAGPDIGTKKTVRSTPPPAQRTPASNDAILVTHSNADSDIVPDEIPIYQYHDVRVVTLTHAAQILQVSMATLKNYRTRGSLEIVRPSQGRRPGLIAIAELRRFLTSKNTKSPARDTRSAPPKPKPKSAVPPVPPSLRDPFELDADAAPQAAAAEGTTFEPAFEAGACTAVPAPPPADQTWRAVKGTYPPITRNALSHITNLEAWDEIKRAYDNPDITTPAINTKAVGLDADQAEMANRLERRYGGGCMLVVDTTTGVILFVGAHEAADGEDSVLLAKESRPKRKTTKAKGGGTGHGPRHPRDAAELIARLRDAGCTVTDCGTYSEVVLPSGVKERVPHRFGDPRGLFNRVTTLARAGVDVRR